MCLATVTSTEKHPADEEVVGYKLVRTSRGRAYPTDFNPTGGSNINVAYPLRRWLRSTTGRIQYTKADEKRGFYPAGFHVLKTRQDAETYNGGTSGYYTIIEVRGRGIVAEGTQMSANVWIVREMRIEHGAIRRG